MSQSLVQIYLHIVFSTKNRAPFLRDMQADGRLPSLVAGFPGI